MLSSLSALRVSPTACFAPLCATTRTYVGTFSKTKEDPQPVVESRNPEGLQEQSDYGKVSSQREPLQMEWTKITGHKGPEDDRRFYSDDRDGELYPSVTTILGKTKPLGSRIALSKWKKNLIAEHGESSFDELQEKTLANGTDLHELVAAWFLTDVDSRDEILIPDHLDQFWESIHPILDDVTDVAAIESAVVNPKHVYAGTIDCIARYKGKLAIIDWKTSSVVRKNLSSLHDYPLQVAAYRHAVMEDSAYAELRNEDLGGFIIVAYSDGTPGNVVEVYPKAMEKYWNRWLARLEEYQILMDSMWETGLSAQSPYETPRLTIKF